ncbi:MAG: beta-ketoacyl synthase chain length factor [Xanthomonadaceae bacterium]|nr:beta-ketoacyl synthase chain length factor [Xanthomonadaceae bacterium]
MSIKIDILGVGISAPGIPDWNGLRAVLDGEPLSSEHELPQTSLLSPRERRRAPATVRLSFAAAEQACAMAEISPDRPAAVFSSAMGDAELADYMCRTLAECSQPLSPTRFHNSVHNAAAGYWSIGTGAFADVTAVSGWNDSAVAGLIEASTRAATGSGPVLLVVYDDYGQGPLTRVWPVRQPFSAALLISAPSTKNHSLAHLALRASNARNQHPDLPAALLERMADNPAARLLPLLALLAGTGPAAITMAAECGSGLHIEKIRA